MLASTQAASMGLGSWADPRMEAVAGLVQSAEARGGQEGTAQWQGEGNARNEGSLVAIC